MSDFPIIIPLCVGVFPKFEVSSFLYGRHQGKKEDFPCIMFVIKAGTHTIVVDTGPYDEEKATKLHVPLKRPQEMEPVQALKSIGVDSDEVDLVILSHLHWDHCGNCKMFKNATFLVQKDELQYAVAPNPVQQTQYDLGFEGVQPSWMEVLDQIQTVDGDVDDVVKGVHLVKLPGHTPGLMGVAVETQKGVHVIASDCIPLNVNWLGDAKQKHIPNGIHINLEDFQYSFEKLERIANVVLASHDFETLKHKQYPVLDE
ncbi:N-acyl homoserine lactonase family protein [Niallia oryzisoli]|uniref:N-acyl homoserine lactonase family protein n=1 Tax=Niallia oryzisoli TaxID=1737571 RepID=A0ABZ2CFA3_9BACI